MPRAGSGSGRSGGPGEDRSAKTAGGKPEAGTEPALPSGKGKDTASEGPNSGERAGQGESGTDTPAKERAATVKVIAGTRRYHSTDCPLIRGAGDSGVETMTFAQAEAAGLTSCSVCQNDHETVA
ncbi:hypothetical protein [Nonomuraea sp. NPDC048916]|uniref:hypothetical protein n=1 Tax=Nonomuraea sp. NPDC048916 TaxID=3154232 RepID=UPI0034032ED4